MTSRQELILEYIRLFTGAHGFPPTLREIANATETSSISVVSYNLGRLEAMGYISRDKDIARGIKILKGESK